MHLKSKNQLTVNKGIAGEQDVIVRGVIQIEQATPPVNMDLTFQYQYSNDATEEILEQGTKLITEAEQQALYQSVKQDLPDINVNFSAWYLSLLYESFRIEMATTFGIPTDDIEIINQ